MTQNWINRIIGPSKAGSRLFWAWAVILLIGGGLLWGKFLNWGLGPYQYHDWAEITIPRLTFLRNAIRAGTLPLHIQDPAPLASITDRFLTVPDQLLSPQVLLLRWMEIEPFLLVNFLLLYLVGFAGLAWIARRKHLSPLAFTLLFLLFNFNGHMIAHISVGHYTWSAYFLFPWLIGLVFDLLDGKAGKDWAWKVVLVLFAMLLQGGYHQFIWSLFLLALLIPVAPRQYRALLRALGFAVLVSAVRTLPAALNLGKFENEYIGGYPITQSIWRALVSVYTPNDFTTNLAGAGQIGTWELSMYVGALAAVFLLCSGMALIYRTRREAHSYAGLLLPIAALTLLSMEDIFDFLRAAIPLPLFTGERVASRIIVLAFLLLLILAVLQLQRWLEALPAAPAIVLALAAFIALIATDLWQNFHLWYIPAAAKKYGEIAAAPMHWSVANHPDPAYTTLLLVGTAISAAGFVFLYLLSYHHARPQRVAPQ